MNYRNISPAQCSSSTLSHTSMAYLFSSHEAETETDNQQHSATRMQTCALLYNEVWYFDTQIKPCSSDVI